MDFCLVNMKQLWNVFIYKFLVISIGYQKLVCEFVISDEEFPFDIFQV